MKATTNIDRVSGLGALQAGTRSAAQISIAVIDGPVDTNHPVFADRRLKPLDCDLRLAHAGAPSRAHGTQVASILFGQPGGALTGIAPECQGLLIPIFSDAEDGGIRPCSELGLARALVQACEHGANVINVSAGRLSDRGVAGPHLEDAIRYCRDTGVLVVAAAGNDGCDCHQVPAAMPGVLAVGAMDDANRPVGFSNWGAAYRERGVLAPGTDIVGAVPGGGVTALTGTSFATPIVAGIAALLMAGQIDDGSELDAQAVMRAIVEGADRCDPTRQDRCERFLAGALNVGGAVRVLESRTGRSSPRAPVPGFAVNTTIRKGSDQMDGQQDDLRTEPASDPMAQSIRAMTDSITAMQASIAELGEALGGLRPSGIEQPVRTNRSAETPKTLGATITTDGQLSTVPAGLSQSTETLNGELIVPDACCEACAANEVRQLVFALGKLGYDFGTESRMDSIQSQMTARRDAKDEDGKRIFDGDPSALNPAHLAAFLKKIAPSAAPALNWVLKLNETPIYAIRPEGYFVQETYKSLVDGFAKQTESAVRLAAWNAKEKKSGSPPPPAIERMSVPGIINGEVELMSGVVVPTVRPAEAGMFMWSTEELVEAVTAFPEKGPNDPGKEGTFDPSDGLRTFLNRIYEELRNVGLAPQDRAMNYAATNAYQATDIFTKIRGRNIHIEKFEVVRSPVMRPDSDCWDVKMTFYNPAAPNSTPREVYFYTVDVSDVVPVAIGEPRHWTTY